MSRQETIEVRQEDAQETVVNSSRIEDILRRAALGGSAILAALALALTIDQVNESCITNNHDAVAPDVNLSHCSDGLGIDFPG